jgi:DNA polymerase-3 subunit alpha
VSVRIEEAAKAGGCGLLMVELDRKPGDETPRVTIRNIRPFEGMTMATRLRLDVMLDDPAGAAALARALEGLRGGRGELHLFARLPDGGTAHLLAGRDYMFDAEMVQRIEKLPGVASARLAPIEGPRLALVG